MRKKVLSLLMTGTFVLSVGLSGCSSKSAKKEYDFYFFNTKSEIAESLENLCEEYKEETGKTVKVFTVGTDDAVSTLRSELQSSSSPALYAANAAQFEEWVQAGYATEVKDIKNEELKKLYETIPETLKLQFNGEGNYGIPYNIEGYGLIANKQMIKDVFELDTVDSFISDYKEATYEEFESLVVAIDNYIKGEVGTCTLNGVTYTTSGEKTSITQELNGVFAVAGAEKWTYGNHYGNYAISTVFNTMYDVWEAKEEEIEKLKNPLVKSLEELEFLTNYTAGQKGAISRGPEYINSTTNGYDQAVQTFANGKAFFIKQGNWIYSNVAQVNKEVADNLTMLPMKVNFEEDDMVAEGMTVDKMNRSVAEFVSQYFIINEKATEEEKVEAEEFLLWLNTSETGKDYMINEFAFVPFNADENTKLTNGLNQDLVTYKVENNLLSNAFDAVPNQWGLECYGKYIMEELFTNPEKWTEEQLNEIADNCINYWKEAIQ